MFSVTCKLFIRGSYTLQRACLFYSFRTYGTNLAFSMTQRNTNFICPSRLLPSSFWMVCQEYVWKSDSHCKGSHMRHRILVALALPQMFEQAPLKGKRSEHGPCGLCGRVEQRLVAPWPAPYSLWNEVTAMLNLFISYQAMNRCVHITLWCNILLTILRWRRPWLFNRRLRIVDHAIIRFLGGEYPLSASGVSISGYLCVRSAR